MLFFRLNQFIYGPGWAHGPVDYGFYRTGPGLGLEYMGSGWSGPRVGEPVPNTALEGGIIASEGGIIALEGSIIALEAVSSFRKRRNRFGGRHYLIASEDGIILSLRRAATSIRRGFNRFGKAASSVLRAF